MKRGADVDVDVDPDTETDIETSGDTDVSTANTMRARASESRIKLWVLLSANRLLVTAALAMVVFVSFMTVGVLADGVVARLQSGDTQEMIFSTMLTAIITGTTLVLTIGQLVVSQENGPLGDQHERMSNTMAVREYLDEFYDHPTPADPSAFLRTLVNETERRASALRDAVAKNENEEFRREVDAFTDSVTGNASTVREKLEGATFGTFDVLYAALDFNYGWKIFQIERLRHEHEDAIDEETEVFLDEFQTVLSMFGPAREHIKTLYFEWALLDLSQLLLYTSVPALTVTGLMLAFASGPIPGTTFGVRDVLWVVGGAFTVSTLPFLLLVSYIGRIATVAKRTLAIGPLILRRSQR